MPKTTLMERMASAMGNGELKIACDRVMADPLVEEMRAFVRSITQHGNVTIEARPTHDDLIPAPARDTTRDNNADKKEIVATS